MQPVIPPSRVAQLKAATSPATMLERLARDCEYSRRRGLRLVDCQAVRVYPRDGDRFVLEYEMRFLGADGERVERVFGEVVGSGTTGAKTVKKCLKIRPDSPINKVGEERKRPRKNV